jgi:hypothetical protein
MINRRVVTVAAVSVSFLLFSALMYAQQRQGGAPAGRNILMVCGDENRRVLPCTSIGDIFVKNRLEIDMGHKVTKIPHDADRAEMLAAATAADLVILAESLLSRTVETKIISTPTPVFSYEAFLPDEFGLINPKGERMDPGTPDQGDYGAIEDQTTINIVNPKHPLAAGLSGRVKVYRVPREMNWAKDLAPSAEVVATLPDYPKAAVIYVIRRGAKLYDGTPSPGLRIQYFIENDNETGTVNLMTEDGYRLFDAAINYALTTDPKG